MEINHALALMLRATMRCMYVGDDRDGDYELKTLVLTTQDELDALELLINATEEGSGVRIVDRVNGFTNGLYLDTALNRAASMSDAWEANKCGTRMREATFLFVNDVLRPLRNELQRNLGKSPMPDGWWWGVVVNDSYQGRQITWTSI